MAYLTKLFTRLWGKRAVAAPNKSFWRLIVSPITDNPGTSIVIGLAVLSYLLVPADLLSVYPPKMSEQPWRIVTALFAHDGKAHITGNMIALASGCAYFERKYSTRAFAALFILGGAAVNSGGLCWMVYKTLPIVLRGASSGVYSVYGALLVSVVLDPRGALDEMGIICAATAAVYVVCADVVCGTFALLGHTLGLALGAAAYTIAALCGKHAAQLTNNRRGDKLIQNTAVTNGAKRQKNPRSLYYG